MKINKDVIKHLKSVESKLIQELEIDIFNTYHTVRMLQIFKVADVLRDVVLSKYCISIYTKYIYPLYVYYEFTNNYLTIERFTADMQHGDLEIWKKLINEGKEIDEQLN